MWTKFTRFVLGKDTELREKLFRIIVIAGVVAAIFGILESYYVVKMDNFLVPVYLLLFVVMLIAMIITFKYQKYDLASAMIGIVIIVIVFPTVFFFSEGLNSGATVWFSLGILYVFSMFDGKKLVAYLLLCIISFATTYIVGYKHPQLLVEVSSRKAAYMDSFFSVIIIGLISGIILKLHIKVYDKEHELNIEQKKELEKNRDSKNKLFANISHEIRTPINAIIGLNEMILRENPNEEIVNLSKDIKLASNMLLNQVNDILDLSQMEMKKMKIIPVEYRTEDMFLGLSELVRFRLEKRGLEFYFDIDRDLPSVLYGDEKRVKQVLLNLLDNAVKYTEEGSVTLSATGEKQEDGSVILSIKVTDTGIGIKKEDLEYIYDSFNRVDEQKNAKIIGSGLGLSITKQLVDLMEGEITVDSIYRKGTVFTVNVRQGIKDDTKIGDISNKSRMSEDEEKYKVSFMAPEARMLIVDDNNMNLQVASKLLAETRMQIDVAYSGQECLEMTKKKRYDIIALDYMMPIMDGAETLKRIRMQENGLCRNSAILVITGNTMSGAREQFLQQGFDGYVEKPIQSKVFEAEILKFLPKDIVEYTLEERLGVSDVAVRNTGVFKRKKVCISTDCVADIPADILEKYGIEVIYLYVITPNGRFADTKEIDSDSIKQYITADSSKAYGDSVTVEEFEEFFANSLEKAENVIHISLASNTGRAHGVAALAAKGFDHVKVIDSGMISCGQALVVIHAAKLAMEGKPYNEICDEIEKIKNKIKMKFIMPGAEIFHRNGRAGAITASICKALQLRPIGTMRQKKAILSGFVTGKMENAWGKAIKRHFNNKREINTDIVYITHVACTVKEIEYIIDEISKMVTFKRVVVQKSCFTNACNAGLGTICIAYYGK